MQIAEEGLFSKKKITVDKARDAKTESEMKSLMCGEYPIDSFSRKRFRNTQKYI